MAAKAPATARGMYKALLRVVERFPPEPILGARTEETQAMEFTEAAKIQIRNAFKENAGAGAAAKAKMLTAAEKELAALQSIVTGQSIAKYPGPPKYEKLHKDVAKK